MTWRAGRGRGWAGLPGSFEASSVSFSLSALGSDTTPLPSWATLNSSAWSFLKQALKGLSVEFALLADKAAQQVSGPSLSPAPGLFVLGAGASPSREGGLQSAESGASG